MSHQGDQRSLMQTGESEGDENAMKAMQSLNVDDKAKPQVVIQAADLKLVMETCHLERSAAIELIDKNEGDIKKTLKQFVNA